MVTATTNHMSLSWNGGEMINRDAVLRALADAQAFLGREGYAHPRRDVSGPHLS
jgi:hypothetical protein